MYKKNSAEAELFQSLAKSIIRGAEINVKEIIFGSAIDWKKFREQILFHELSPFLYPLFKNSEGIIPEDLKQLLKRNYYATLARAENLWQEFLSLAKVFKAKEISMVPIKGIASLADIYRERPFRSMVDMDILVKKEELARVEEVLRELRYEKALGGLKETYWLEKNCELTFVKKISGRPFWLDVHFGLDFKRLHTIQLPRLWERVRYVPVGGQMVALLSPEDQLFSIALHGRRYGGRPLCLKNILDLAIILEKYREPFDWGYVVREAHAGRMQSTVFFILLQVAVFFDTSVPDRVWKGFEVPFYKQWLMRRLIERNTFIPYQSATDKAIFLKSHFLLFDDFWEPLLYLLNIPIEQFAKYYDLAPYEKRTRFFYRVRLIYILIGGVLCGKQRRENG